MVLTPGLPQSNLSLTCDRLPHILQRPTITPFGMEYLARLAQALRSMRSTRARLSQQADNFQAVATDVATLTSKVNSATDRGLTDL